MPALLADEFWSSTNACQPQWLENDFNFESFDFESSLFEQYGLSNPQARLSVFFRTPHL